MGASADSLLQLCACVVQALPTGYVLRTAEAATTGTCPCHSKPPFVEVLSAKVLSCLAAGGEPQLNLLPGLARAVKNYCRASQVTCSRVCLALLGTIFWLK